MKKTIQVDWQPEDGIQVITTGTGYFKAGVKGKVIAGNEREVFLEGGKRITIPEFTLELTHNGKTWIHPNACQYGRDFVFAFPPLDEAANRAIGNYVRPPR